MKHRDYVAQREANDPEFREACEKLRPEYEYRRALISRRLAAGLSQREMAERLGVSQSMVAKLETGRARLTVDTLHRLAATLGVDFVITPQTPLLVRTHQAAAAS